MKILLKTTMVLSTAFGMSLSFANPALADRGKIQNGYPYTSEYISQVDSTYEVIPNPFTGKDDRLPIHLKAYHLNTEDPAYGDKITLEVFSCTGFLNGKTVQPSRSDSAISTGSWRGTKGIEVFLQTGTDKGGIFQSDSTFDWVITQTNPSGQVVHRTSNTYDSVALSNTNWHKPCPRNGEELCAPFWDYQYDLRKLEEETIKCDPTLFGLSFPPVNDPEPPTDPETPTDPEDPPVVVDPPKPTVVTLKNADFRKFRGPVTANMNTGWASVDGKKVKFNVRSTFYGTNKDDRITGSARADRIYGLGGNDTISSGSGNDIVYGGTGTDRINGGNGHDRIYGQAGNDKLHGGAGNDKIYGQAGHDYLAGQAGKDYLNGGGGNDRMVGGAQRDVCVGGPGKDRPSQCEVRQS